jgi:GNAT superfamily N-acetyltransferase
MAIEIGLLADRPELIGQLAEAYEAAWPGWYGPGGQGDARADLEARCRRDGIPCAIVAAEGSLAVGSCALARESMSQSLETGAWLVVLWVRPSHRRLGLATRLLQAAVDRAAALGIAEVRAGTQTPGPFEQAGWTRQGVFEHDGREIELFAIRPGRA